MYEMVVLGAVAGASVLECACALVKAARVPEALRRWMHLRDE